MIFRLLHSASGDSFWWKSKSLPPEWERARKATSKLAIIVSVSPPEHGCVPALSASVASGNKAIIAPIGGGDSRGTKCVGAVGAVAPPFRHFAQKGPKNAGLTRWG